MRIPLLPEIIPSDILRKIGKIIGFVMRNLCKFAFFFLGLISSVVRAEPLDRVVAVVNDGVISQVELSQRLQLAKQQLLSKSQVSDPLLKKQILDQMILEKIEQQLAERSGIQVPDAMIEKAIESMAEQENLSSQAFQNQLLAKGIHYDQFREQIRANLMIQQLQKRDLGNQISVSDREIDQYLRSKEGQDIAGAEYHLSHILIALPQDPNATQIEQAKKETEQLLAQLRQGADFNTLAAHHSKGPQAMSGGDLGWRTVEELPTLFSQDVSKMKAGQIAGPFRNASGFHIVKLVEKRQPYSELMPHQTHVRHILVKTNTVVSAEQAFSRAQLLRAMIQNKKDFGAVAKSHSDDLNSKASGGDLGWISNDKVAKEFQITMDRLPLNAVSEPFQTEEGWHIIQVVGRKELKLGDEWTREKALQVLQARKFEEKLNDWQQQLKEQSFIEVL